MKNIIIIAGLLVSLTSSAAEVCIVNLFLKNPLDGVPGVFNSMKCTGAKPFKLEFFSKDVNLDLRQITVINEFEDAGFQLRTKTVFDHFDRENVNYELVFVKNDNKESK